MLRLQDVTVAYSRREIFSGSITLRKGLLTGIVGESGSGKSTLMNILSLYSYEQNFDYYYNDTNLRNESIEYLSRIQKQKIAYLRQENKFLDTMNCLENLQLEASIAGVQLTKEEIAAVLNEVGLSHVLKKYPKQLSGGEKQRLAIAMAIIKEAEIVLCDEITSSLDKENTQLIMQILKKLAHENGKIVFVASHEEDVIALCDEIYEIVDKRLVFKSENKGSYENKLVLDDVKEIEDRGYLFKIALSRLKKKKVLFGLLIGLTSIAIALTTYCSTWLHQQEQITSSLLNTALTNEIFVNNNITQHNFKAFNMSEFPIEESVIEKISEIKAVDKVYPFYTLSVMDTTYPISVDDGSVVEWYENGNKLGEYNFNINTFNSEPHCVYPYFEEQHFDELVANEVTQKNGIYLDKVAAKTFGITEITENMTMLLDVYIPVAINDIQIVVGSDNSYVDGKGYSHFIKTKIELPISGILPNSYTDSAVASNTTSIFIPYETMKKMFDDALATYTCASDEELYSVNALKVFVSSAKEMTNVKNKILNISPDLFLFDTYQDYDSASDALQGQKTFVKMAVLVMIAMLLVLLFIYGVYHKKDAFEDYYFFNIRGFLKKEKQMIALFETLYICVVFFVLSMIFTNYFILNGIGDYVLSTGMIGQINYFLVGFIDFGLSVVAGVVSELPLFLIKQ